MLDFNNYQRGARRVAVEERKKAAARCLPLTLDRLVRPMKVYSLGPTYS
jgi:hypothetical protein